MFFSDLFIYTLVSSYFSLYVCRKNIILLSLLNRNTHQICIRVVSTFPWNINLNAII